MAHSFPTRRSSDLLAQSHERLELIVVDDRSSDRSEARLGRWPVFRHWAASLAVEAERLPGTRS